MMSTIADRRISRMVLVAALVSAICGSSHVRAEAQNPASGRAIASRSQNGVGIEVGHSAEIDRIAIDTGAEKPEYRVSKLSNPPRLVIDVVSQKVSSNKNFAIADLDLVSGIRLGAHPTSGRVVMDLTPGQDIAHDVHVQSGKIIVSLSTNPTQLASAKTTAPTQVQVATVTTSGAVSLNAKVEPRLPGDDSDPTKSRSGASSSRGQLKIENAAVPASLGDAAKEADVEKDSTSKSDSTEREPDIQASKASVVPVSAKIGSSTLTTIKDVRLTSSDEGPSVVAVEVSAMPEYSIRRTAPSEYVLSIKNASIPENVVSNTLFSKAQDSAIRSVRSTIEGKDALIRIFAQPSVYLTARAAGSKIIVEETRDLGKVVSDIRAQLSPSEEKKDGDKKDNPSARSDDGKKAKGSSATAKPASAPKSDANAEMSDSEVQALLGDTARYSGKLISLDLQDTDIDNALRIIAEVSNLNIVASEEVVGKVTLRLTDVPWDQALDVILKTHGLDKVLEGNVMRIAPIDKLRVERESLKQAQVAEDELAPLIVKYMRVSYGKAAELKSLVETVLSERGSVAYDERSNQLIVKDIESGIENVTELIAKVDLRTPQVLLETQIVEATRNLTRELGSELGFQYIQSPATGNGTGLNFPAAVSIGGSAIPATGGATNITGSAFPIASTALGGSALTMLFDSADGTKTLELRLSQLEQEGRIKIVSRPAVATTNNKAAEIKSVERYRVKLPNGGTSVATGQGSVANGTGGSATEIIEAGIILNVTPQASPDYYILLDIKAKSSSFGSKTVDGIPNEIERSASSSVLVSSGQTFALGGIYKISDIENLEGVPFFKDIPFLGTFFRRSQTGGSDEELLFFITPRIVEGSFDDSSMKMSS